MPLGHSAWSPAAHFDEFVYSGQVTLSEESDQLRLHCHSATTPRAQQLNLSSSFTLDRSCYLRSQISSGYNATKATMPGAQLLTLTSSSALHRPCYLRSQTSSGYIAIRLERHQGHSARSLVAHFDELICSTQATLPQESDQLRLHCHSAGTPPRPQCQEPSCSLGRALLNWSL